MTSQTSPQQVSVVTRGVADLAGSRRFYGDGFGWQPVYSDDEIIFYQMNGFVLGTWLEKRLRDDLGRGDLCRPGAFALAHNVPSREDVDRVLARLTQAGGRLLRDADEPPHGGCRGYVADPDDHAWEIAWNPSWRVDDGGMVTFGA